VIHDAIELELFRHLLVSIAEEMGVVLRRSSYSANIKERRDYSCAVYDAQGETVAMGLRPGDVALVNDPFRGGTHLPDITAVAPVFERGKQRPSFYLANRAHHADVGGMSPGSMPMAREIYQEGLRIPPIKIQRHEEIDGEILGLILANVRTPVEREGDLRAQLASLHRGEQRVRELIEKYGAARVVSKMSALQDYSERMMRAAVQKLPQGKFCFEDCLDNDGIHPEPIWIRVEVRIGDTVVVDFSGSDPQAEGPVNANYAVTMAAVMYVFRCLVEEDIPFTSGILRPIRVIAPAGSVVNANAPAAMAAGNVETSQRITDVVLGALAKAIPDRIPAASSGTMNNLSFGGWDASRNRPFAYYETIAGGMGASSKGEGHSATHTHMTNSWNTPVEAFEHQYPLRIESYRVRRGSGGKGTHSGGDGIVREFRFLAPAEVTLLSDRRERGPWGLAGGSPGKPGKNTLVRAGKQTSLPAKSRFEVRAGDVVRIETPGGGGWGR
jgi:N-methylhydantoinase B